VSKRPEYLAKAAEHSRLAETCQSEEARKIHRDLAEWFLLLADDGSSHVGAPVPPAQVHVRPE
jgi:hypothetical protein